MDNAAGVIKTELALAMKYLANTIRVRDVDLLSLHNRIDGPAASRS